MLNYFVSIPAICVLAVTCSIVVAVFPQKCAFKGQSDALEKLVDGDYSIAKASNDNTYLGTPEEVGCIKANVKKGDDGKSLLLTIYTMPGGKPITYPFQFDEVIEGTASNMIRKGEKDGENRNIYIVFRYVSKCVFIIKLCSEAVDSNSPNPDTRYYHYAFALNTCSKSEVKKDLKDAEEKSTTKDMKEVSCSK